MKAINAIESSILQQLQTHLPDILITSYPDNPLEYKLNHPVAAVLVLYGGALFSDPFAMVRTVQEEKHRFKTAIVVRSLSGPGGAYEQIQRVHNALHDYRIPGCLPMFAESIDLIGEESGVWVYNINWIVEIKLA